MRPSLLGLVVALLCNACAGSSTQPHAPNVLPLRSLRLYETGVGYFERTGQVAGDNALPVPTSHLDDALKSLVILGPGARVQALTFPSNLSRTMARALVGLPEGSENLAYRNLLVSLKGAQVELTLARETLVGRLVEVSEEEIAAARREKKEGEKKEEGATEPARRQVSVVVLTGGGVLHKVSLDEITGVKPLDPTFAQRLGASLDATAARGAQTQRALRLLGEGGPVTFGYIAETPVWRASYRILIEGEASAFQGWALLHNDTDEDWKQIRLSLVNGRPDSFLFPLAAPRYLRRELVHPEHPMPTVPQLLDKNADELWGEGESFGAGGLGLSGVGEGGGGRGEGIGLGSVGTVGHGSGSGDSSLLAVGNLAGVAQATGSEQGALFSYAVNEPISLPAHSSALVPFLEQKLNLRPITWIDDGARSGVRFENTTGQTLPAGTVAFFSGGGFAGESTLERLKPGERRFLTFGADLDVELTDAMTLPRDEVKRVVASGSRLEEHFLRTTERDLVIHNRSPSPKTVYLVLKLHRNAQVKGADGLDFDTVQQKPVAFFELTAKQKAERKLTSVEGLSRSKEAERFDPEQLRKMADALQGPAEERGALRELASKRAEQDDHHRLIEAATGELGELDRELERLRKNLEALGGDKSQRPDSNPFVRRILAAEDRRAEVRKRLDALQKQTPARRDAVLAVLKKMEARKLFRLPADDVEGEEAPLWCYPPGVMLRSSLPSLLTALALLQGCSAPMASMAPAPPRGGVYADAKAPARESVAAVSEESLDADETSPNVSAGPSAPKDPPPPPPRPTTVTGSGTTAGTESKRAESDGRDSGKIHEQRSPLLIYVANFTLAVAEVMTSLREVERMALEAGGFVAKRDDRSITLRVPAARFQKVVAEIEKVGDVVHRDVSAQDVTEEYLDTEVRLRNARAMRDRLEQLRAKAATVADALAIERELARINAEIDRMEGRLKFLRDRATFSTITVSFEARRTERAPSTVRLPFPWLRRSGLSRLLSL